MKLSRDRCRSTPLNSALSPHASHYLGRALKKIILNSWQVEDPYEFGTLAHAAAYVDEDHYEEEPERQITMSKFVWELVA